MVKAKTLQVVWHSKEPVYSGGWWWCVKVARLFMVGPDGQPLLPRRRRRRGLVPAQTRICHPRLLASACSAAVDFHPNGQLATGGADKEVKVWEVRAAAAGAYRRCRP